MSGRSELPDWAKAIRNFDPSGPWLPIVCFGSVTQQHPMELIGIYFPHSVSGDWTWEGSPYYDENGNFTGHCLTRVMTNRRWFREADGERVETWQEEDGTMRELRFPSTIPEGQVRTGMTSDGRGTPFIGCPNPECEVNPRVTLEQFERWLELGHEKGLQFLDTSGLVR